MNDLQRNEHVEFIAGLNLGQASDFTALAVLRRAYTSSHDRDTTFELRTLYRWPTGTPYPQIVAEVERGLVDDAFLCRRVKWNGAADEFYAPTTLVIDGTGVGRAVIDMFRAANLRADLRPVTITDGDDVALVDGYYRVPKRELVGVVQVALQTKRLKIAPELREAETLRRELQNFKMKITANAHDTYGAWREGEHDDLVLATALALWSGERFGEAPTDLDNARLRQILEGNF